MTPDFMLSLTVWLLMGRLVFIADAMTIYSEFHRIKINFFIYVLALVVWPFTWLWCRHKWPRQ